ncbi:unnamed protein product [Rotaria socialis]|uniref:ZMYM2-like/QRICH1 C-terminal domain-containing protein n=1 Tax=Rotaria socialis TaxID=392032 RepID=A0A817WZ93_9BILA|nr:unnamed protein product [Rotaria socialis]
MIRNKRRNEQVLPTDGDAPTKICRDLNGGISLATVKRWYQMIRRTGSIELSGTYGGPLNTYISLIDEDLLYDIYQFGILTPWSLLTTFIYTNTKYFNLKTVESHMAIGFANFGKYSQWVRLSTTSPQGQQMNYLRFDAHNPGGTTDVLYLHPISEQIPENSLWFSHEPLSSTIIDQILNHLNLLPDFYTQTKPVETGPTSSTGQINSATSKH